MTTSLNAPSLTPEQVVAWRDAAIQDGWAVRAAAMATDVKLTRDGYKASVTMRPSFIGPHGRPVPAYYRVDLWSSDDIAITVPSVYSLDAIKTAERTCWNCGATDVETVRVHFATRSCKACAPTLRAQLETPGWCD